MLDKETRTAIFALSRQGHGPSQIAKALNASRNSVKKVLKSGVAEPPAIEKPAKLDERLEEIRGFYAECLGNLVRVREKLADSGCRVSYSTLTWFCRQQGIGVEEKTPTARILTEKGEESQTDTSPYNIVIGGKKVKRHCASLVLGYSRMLYMAFFPRFDRFHCKIFLTDAFSYMGGVCRRLVIDNTSVVIACGAGQMAQVAPEMEAFEKRFGFKFLAHELMHSNRKGKIERPYRYIETNFLVGRSFKDDADLNRQAIEWLEKTANPRRLREFKASPLELFAAEKPHLAPLPLYIPEVYRTWQRTVDSYGYVRLDAMKYRAPAAYLLKEVMLRETKDRVIVLDGHKEIANHAKKIEGAPPDEPRPPYTPRRPKQAQLMEEANLKAMGEVMAGYLEALKLERGPRYALSVRKLYRLLCQYKAQDLMAAVAKAKEHRLFDINRVESILLQDIAQRDYFLPLEFPNPDYEKWPQYQQGAVTPEPAMDDYTPWPDDAPQEGKNAQ
jgi:transposase